MYRLRSAQALGLVTVGVFGISVLSTGLAPLTYQSGWLRAVATVNPLTPVLATGRQGFIGPVSWQQTEPGLLAVAGVTVVLSLWAASGMRSLTNRP
jgi:ABC-2 type transport system permease protein